MTGAPIRASSVAPLQGGLALQPTCAQILRDKYLQPEEQRLGDLFRRVAHALAAPEAPPVRDLWQGRFRAALDAGFLPAGRILAAAGVPSRAGTWMSCFVQPLAGEAIEDLEAQAVKILQMGGGVGYDFSALLPEAACRETVASRAAAECPLPVMQRLEQRCQAQESAAARRGAQMAVLRCDHPDIEAFINAKLDAKLDAKRGAKQGPRDGKPVGLSHFNLSVGVTDAFMRAVTHDQDWPLVHAVQPGEAAWAPGVTQAQDGLRTYRVVRARALWDRLAQASWAVGEPGVLFLDTLQRENPLSDIEHLVATNPCGEQPLPPYGSCCLGALDLTRFVQRPFEPGATFDEVHFGRVAAVAVRMLDNVLDLTPWPLPEHRQQALSKRRIGLGLTGLADALLMLNLRYDSALARRQAGRMAEVLRDAAYAASSDLAEERGSFALFDPRRWLTPGPYLERLPVGLRRKISERGLRNSHLLSVAPTGSISLALADNVSPGIEPVLAWAGRRRVRSHASIAQDVAQEVAQNLWVEDHAWRLYRHLYGEGVQRPPHFVLARDMTPEAQVAMVAAVAPYIDGGISKTVNLGPSVSWRRVQALFEQAWREGLKGLTVFRGRGPVNPEEAVRPQL